MKFDLTQPCSECPFRTDCLQGWLGKSRAAEIADSIKNGSTFPCHKTTEFDDEGESIGVGEQHCAGALILLDKSVPNGTGSSNILRIAMRLRIFDPDKLKIDAPVFATFEEFVDHHDLNGRVCKIVKGVEE